MRGQNESKAGTPSPERLGSPEIVRQARHYVREALIGLEQNYPNWDEAGKKYAVECAIRSCDEAWRRLTFVLENTQGQPRREDNKHE